VPCYVSDCASVKINILMWYLNWVVMLNVRVYFTRLVSSILCLLLNVIYNPNTTELHLARRVTIHSPGSCMVGNMMTKYIVHDTVNFASTTSRHSPTSAVEILESRRASAGTSVFNHTICAKSECYEVSSKFCALPIKGWPHSRGALAKSDWESGQPII
jgi:hypothetical protein